MNNTFFTCIIEINMKCINVSLTDGSQFIMVEMLLLTEHSFYILVAHEKTCLWSFQPGLT